jgi:hypothetical protein
LTAVKSQLQASTENERYVDTEHVKVRVHGHGRKLHKECNSNNKITQIILGI